MLKERLLHCYISLLFPHIILISLQALRAFIKFSICISYGSKVMAKVKVFMPQTDSHRVTDRTKTRSPRIPFRGEGVKNKTDFYVH